MTRNNLPLLFMLVAGAASWIITNVKGYSTLGKLSCLFIVMLIFSMLGGLLKFVLNKFEEQNEKKKAEEGAVIEKEAAENGEENSPEGKDAAGNE